VVKQRRRGMKQRHGNDDIGHQTVPRIDAAHEVFVA
jgi:hypothetical protein